MPENSSSLILLLSLSDIEQEAEALIQYAFRGIILMMRLGFTTSRALLRSSLGEVRIKSIWPGGRNAVLHHRKRSCEYGEMANYVFDNIMINLIEGQLDLGAKKILIVSDYGDLNAFAKEGLIEKRNDPGKGAPYFYIESEEDGMKFGVTISLQEKKIEWFLLRWLDGPCTSKGWDGVSEKALKDEYRLLLNLVEKMVGRTPDKKANRERTWRFKWGQIDVSYEPRSFDAAIFMVPR